MLQQQKQQQGGPANGEGADEAARGVAALGLTSAASGGSEGERHLNTYEYERLTSVGPVARNVPYLAHFWPRPLQGFLGAHACLNIDVSTI